MKQQIHLLQKDFTTVDVVFDDDISVDDLKERTVLAPHQRFGGYTYKAELSLNLQVGDFVLVPARNSLKVVRVIDVHPYPKLDLEAKFAYKWVIQKIDATAYLQRMQEEQELMEILQRLDWLEQEQKLKQRLLQASQNDKTLITMLENKD